jgi:hypothetical protein
LASLSGPAPKIPVTEPPAAPRVASLGSDAGITELIGRAGFGNGWVQAPAYDEEHPDEMSYRPFPVTPYMTTTASADDPALSHMTHPDVAKTLDMLDQAGSMPPMRLRPTQQIAQLMWAQEFKGGMADVEKLFAAGDDLIKPSGVSNRNVKTAKE